MKLGFGEVLSESFEFFFTRLRLFFHLVTLPWILSLLLRVAGAALTEETLPIVLMEKAVDVLPTVMFMVAWMRVVLLGPARVDRLPGLKRVDDNLYSFFRNPEFQVNGKTVSLDALEKKIIRPRFKDGRIHFALNCASGGCPRLPVWSSPLVKVKGEPAGTPDLDNARVIREQAARVAAFR